MDGPGQKSPTNAGVGSAFEHLKHLEIPGQGHGDERGRSESMRGRSDDFAAGYSLGLIGGVRSWVSISIFHERLRDKIADIGWL